MVFYTFFIFLYSSALFCTLVALWRHPILQPPNVRELPYMTITIYLGGKYATSHLIIDLESVEANIQNPTCNEAANMQTPFNRVAAHYNLIPTNYFFLE